MGFWSKLFGKKDDEKPVDDQTMQNPATPAEESEDSAEVSEEEAE